MKELTFEPLALSCGITAAYMLVLELSKRVNKWRKARSPEPEVPTPTSWTPDSISIEEARAHDDHRRALRNSPTNPETLIETAQAAARAGELVVLANTLTTLDAMVLIGPSGTRVQCEATFLRAELQALRGDFVAARASLKRGIGLRPVAPSAARAMTAALLFAEDQNANAFHSARARIIAMAQSAGPLRIELLGVIERCLLRDARRQSVYREPATMNPLINYAAAHRPELAAFFE